jgi:hypothetical protein
MAGMHMPLSLPNSLRSQTSCPGKEDQKKGQLLVWGNTPLKCVKWLTTTSHTAIIKVIQRLHTFNVKLIALSIYTVRIIPSCTVTSNNFAHGYVYDNEILIAAM